MRLLLAESADQHPGAELDEAALTALYAGPLGPWLRVNFVSTLDGAANGRDGRTGTINTEADGVVFHLLRRLSDVVVVGAGTVRVEGYGRLTGGDGAAPPLAVVSSSGRLPDHLLRPADGRGDVLLVTHAGAAPEAVAAARNALGADAVILAGEHTVDLGHLRDELVARGLPRMLSEGGPTLFGALLAQGCVDELDLTWAPAVVGGAHPRIVTGGEVEVPLEPMLLVEEGGTVMGRWRVVRS